MPDWLASTVIYEVNTPVFSPQGTFNAVTARLSDLASLGIGLIWLMPVHPFGRVNAKPPFGSQYAIRDYYAVNPDYGTPADLRELVDAAHRLGMRVIIDIVANHTSWDSVLLAEHPEFFRHDAAGRILRPNDDWTDVAALDYSNPALRQYMIDMLGHWLREYHLDGFRCDVAGLVPVDFWEQARVELERINPELVMLAEWGDPALLRRAFDLDYSSDLYSTLKNVLTVGSEAWQFRRAWEDQHARYPAGALHLRYTENHDEERAISLFGQNGAMAAAALMFTLDGVPLLYNGQEVGDTTESGVDAMFHRLKIFWPIANRRPQFSPFFARLVALRRSSTTLQRGTLRWLDHDAADFAVLFDRYLPNGSPAATVRVAVNLTNRPIRFAMPDAAAFHAPDTVGLSAWAWSLWFA